MREHTVNWQTFEQSKPKEGVAIVIETATGCVTGKFAAIFNIVLAASNRKVRKVAHFRRKHGDPAEVPVSCRWYPKGSDCLKVKNL